MPVTIILSTLPGMLTREDKYTSRTVEVFGRSLGTKILLAIRNIADIKTTVASFGAETGAKHPEASFYVSVTLPKGCRKPNGYDDGSRRNSLGQDAFMHVTDKCTKPAPSEAIRMMQDA